MQFTRRSIFEIDAIDAIALVDVGKTSSPFLNKSACTDRRLYFGTVARFRLGNQKD
jgi:hypothetical protein